MLIDSGHKTWIWTTLALGLGSLVLYFWLNARTPGGLTGGSSVGLWYGVAGSVLMIYAGLLSALRRFPSRWWLGSRKFWLKGHIWMGLLSGVLILCHSGFRLGGWLEMALMLVVGLVLLTGVIGLVLQQVLPRLMTTRIVWEAPYQQIPQLSDLLRRKADELIDKARADPKLDADARTALEKFYVEEARPFLQAEFQARSPLANALQAEIIFDRITGLPGLAPVKAHLDTLAQFCEERRQWGEQERLHRLLHGWLLLHIPLSVLLLVLGLAHVLSALYY